jgi:hypothetical protein
MPRAEALGFLMGIGLPGSPLLPPDPATGSRSRAPPLDVLVEGAADHLATLTIERPFCA